MSMQINITLRGPMACGKTRATKAIRDALARELHDKEYTVNWKHELADNSESVVTMRYVVSERGTFAHKPEENN